MNSAAPAPVRVVRIIDRLNVGGPARHVVWLTAALRTNGFETVLITGSLPALVRELAQGQRHTDEQLRQLTVQVQPLAAQVREQGEQMRRQGERIQALTPNVDALVSWQRGEAGRREGERYEREILRRALALFDGGQGGSPEQNWVQQRLTTLLEALRGRDILPAEEDPFLADLVWWKRDQLAVVEVALQIHGDDVRRAARRAGTLQQAGATALAVVIGEDWLTGETRDRALTAGVEWKVGAELSEGFLAFRRRRSRSGEGPQSQASS